jgi:hypothetical protein
MTKSGFTSAFKSATSTPVTEPPPESKFADDGKVRLHRQENNATALSPGHAFSPEHEIAAIRSGWPSPFTSTTATEFPETIKGHRDGGQFDS